VRDGEGTENWFSVCERKGRRKMKEEMRFAPFVSYKNIHKWKGHFCPFFFYTLPQTKISYKNAVIVLSGKFHFP
jgi:hypothetical protein